MVRRTGIKVEYLDDGRQVLLEAYGEIPAGFVFDGASVPRFFWRLFGHPYDKHHVRGSLRHDYAYEQGLIPRAQADRQYREDIIEDGMPRAFAWLEWLGVRLGGWRHYNNG